MLRTVSEGNWHEDVLRTIIAASVIRKRNDSALLHGTVDEIRCIVGCSHEQRYRERAVGFVWDGETFGIAGRVG